MSQTVTNITALPVLPLKNTVLFPYLFMPLAVGRPGSVAAVEQVLGTEEKTFVAVAQRDSSVDQPGTGTSAPRRHARRDQERYARREGGMEMLVQGVERVELLEADQTEPFLKARVVAPAGARRHGHRGRGAVSAPCWNWRLAFSNWCRCSGK